MARYYKSGLERPLADIRPPGRIYWGGRPNIYGRAAEFNSSLTLSLLLPVFSPATPNLLPLFPLGGSLAG